MKKFWQNEWHNIQFSDLDIEITSKNLPGLDFYNSFYLEFFTKYDGYEDLSQHWCRGKDIAADWIASELSDNSTILSVGCGLGYIEQKLWKEHSNRLNIHVLDYASESLKWLKKVIPQNHIHDPTIESKNLLDVSFDMIYLSAVEYSLDDKSLIKLLSDYKKKLKKNGRLVIINASLSEDSSFSLFRSIKETLETVLDWVGLRSRGQLWGWEKTQKEFFFKEMVKAVLDFIGLRSRGQLWGWKRTNNEFYYLMQNTGFNTVDNGSIENGDLRIYWFSGKMA